MKSGWIVITGSLLLSCKVPNLDHCYNRATFPNSWCIENHESRPYCSPCEAEQNGCVREEPDPEECPEYIPGTDDAPTDDGGPTSGETDSSSSTGESTTESNRAAL